MKFEKGIAKKYRKSVEDAFDVMLEKGNDSHREVAELILDSKMLVRVGPVSKINASGVTGLIDTGDTNDRIEDEKLSVEEALDEIYIAIAEETIDTGGQRGCEGTFVHEGQHAYDFAEALSILERKLLPCESLVTRTALAKGQSIFEELASGQSSIMKAVFEI